MVLLMQQSEPPIRLPIKTNAERWKWQRWHEQIAFTFRFRSDTCKNHATAKIKNKSGDWTRVAEIRDGVKGLFSVGPELTPARDIHPPSD